MENATKTLIKMYAAAVDNDIDKILEFEQVLLYVVQDIAGAIQESYIDYLSDGNSNPDNYS